MKPLKKGKARTELAENIGATYGPGESGADFIKPPSPDALAALIGGALEETLASMGEKDTSIFWRYFNHNLWNLTRSLRASNLLHKV